MGLGALSSSRFFLPQRLALPAAPPLLLWPSGDCDRQGGDPGETKEETRSAARLLWRLAIVADPYRCSSSLLLSRPPARVSLPCCSRTRRSPPSLLFSPTQLQRLLESVIEMGISKTRD
ncbi:unnamed protein product [Linum trigynum]|uniref:Uncharacterized protein n=1 Tax=Linum trigynum TaxID=586398 RepID=A0AAV2CU78_9ROSI